MKKCFCIFEKKSHCIVTAAPNENTFYFMQLCLVNFPTVVCLRFSHDVSWLASTAAVSVLADLGAGRPAVKMSIKSRNVFNISS